MKKAKENWIGERCSEMEENLRKNNNKRTQQLLKDLTTVKQGTAVQGDLLRICILIFMVLVWIYGSFYGSLQNGI